MGRIGLGIVFAIIFLSMPALSAEIKVERLTKDSDYGLITVSGAIVPGDSERFRVVSTAYKSSIVQLESGGGDVHEAIEIGKIVQVLRHSTYVENGQRCDSACALIWLAGSTRFLDDEAKVGLHAAYIGGSSGGKRESGVANALVGSYLTQLGLSERAIAFATSAPPEQINYLSLKNAAQFDIAVESLDDSDSSTAKASTGPAETKSFANVGPWAVGIDDTLQGNCFMYIRWPDGLTMRIGYLDGKRTYIAFFNDAWRSLKEDVKYPLVLETDGSGKWAGDFAGIQIGGKMALIAQAPYGIVMSYFTKTSLLRIYYENKLVSGVGLEMTSEAFASMAKCQAAQMRAYDPFAR